ncbi:hypothetical protein [Alteromonas sp. KUL49]|uniref:hypothetical protein n=1 Tax=Alteromonas sp. KUL49 TaxID=2480798 RepID=UPI00102ED783|nr:hypothetical protein [Alteromonas sp. KUL49]TAP37883.1 hypothetical protein EYS00_15400 [Alteromonas sp. KUL49]GEA12743.1 hypothetical protein KUL49_31180 [Alteromonas sp. KUL49]
MLPSPSINFSPPIELIRDFHNVNAEILAISAFLRSFITLGDVFLDTVPQSLEAKLANAAGARVSYLMNQPLCDHYGLDYIQSAKSCGVLPVALGGNEIDINVEPRVEAGFEGLAENAETIKVRKLDSYLSGRVNVSWTVFSQLTLDKLTGAKELVQTHRPLFSGIISPECILDVSEWCITNGYHLVDSDLQDIQSVPVSAYCWLVPTKSMLQQAYRYLGKDSGLVKRSLPLVRLIQQSWPELLGANDNLAKKTYDLIANQRTWYYLDSLANIGLDSIETDGENYWRWLGKNGARLFLPLHSEGYFRLSFNFFSLASGLSHATLRCFINGRLMTTYMIEEGTELSVSYFAREAGEVAEILLVSEEACYIDGKFLSCSLSEVTLQWVDS